MIYFAEVRGKRNEEFFIWALLGLPEKRKRPVKQVFTGRYS